MPGSVATGAVVPVSPRQPEGQQKVEFPMYEPEEEPPTVRPVQYQPRYPVQSIPSHSQPENPQVVVVEEDEDLDVDGEHKATHPYKNSVSECSQLN